MEQKRIEEKHDEGNCSKEDQWQKYENERLSQKSRYVCPTVFIIQSKERCHEPKRENDEFKEHTNLSIKRNTANSSVRLDDGVNAPKWKFWKRRRYIVTLMAFIGFFHVLSLRAIVSVAVASMTTKHAVILENSTSEVQDFNWDTRLQGLVLSSYFYGYISTQILGGWLASRIGGNVLFGFGIAITSALTVLSPLFISVSVYLFIGVRVLEGIFEGVSYPSMHDLWANWAPPLERSRLATIGFSGSHVGTVVSFSLSGILAEHVGWESIFYTFGCLGMIWYPAWVILVKRGPQYDNCIDPSEKKYIQDALGSRNSINKKVIHPWTKFFTSLPVWAIIVANFAENWGLYTLLTGLPTFIKDTLEFDMQESGILSSLPTLVVCFTMQIAGHIADFILVKQYLTTTQVRKIFCCGAFVGQAIFMLLTAVLLTPVGAITCLTIAVGIGSFAMAGFFVNHLDIAPQHASVLMGIGNTAGTMPGIISPIVTGYLVPNKTTSEWRVVFFIASGIYFFGAIFYALFASGEKQTWAMEDVAPKHDFVEGGHE